MARSENSPLPPAKLCEECAHPLFYHDPEDEERDYDPMFDPIPGFGCLGPVDGPYELAGPARPTCGCMVKRKPTGIC